MAGRRLDPGEAALWARVAAAVKPLHGPRPVVPVAPLEKHGAPRPEGTKRVMPPVAARATPPRMPGNTLDAGWDRRLARGMVVPDATIDLHGHTLASAHSRLDHDLGRSIARGDRILLLITGRPPRAESERPHARGAIRAAIGDWIAASRHVDRIASIRTAHPRHGGGGAMYLILRRNRTE